VCHIQRSCGYALRPTLTVAEIAAIVSAVRTVSPDIIVTVDNCYGEFTEAVEPGAVGADLVMGSLIKNPGGTLATGALQVGAVATGVLHGVAALLIRSTGCATPAATRPAATSDAD
jgi:cystathionine beta-lyase family protein involved in aluminum resistance